MPHSKPASLRNPRMLKQVRLFLAGDVMTGRGIDQVLPHPCDPVLFESYVKSAIDYVRLAEAAHGRIPKPVGFEYVWGDALQELECYGPDTRLVNLETAITTSDDAQPKDINYRMAPTNTPILKAAQINCCTLANNHVLDWGEDGLVETLETLRQSDIATAGAGRTLAEAEAPAILPVAGGRVLIFAFATPSSGVPANWAVVGHRPGINRVQRLDGDAVSSTLATFRKWKILPRLDADVVSSTVATIRKWKQPGDIAVVSLHWGGNWGYKIPAGQQAFARGLIDEAAADVIWGHSSHHAKAIEVYGGKLILYGCGDFINDYEGIRGYEEYRDDLVLMYFPSLRISDGMVIELIMVPLQIRNFRLKRASRADAEWLANMLNREGAPFGTSFEVRRDNSLVLKWKRSS